MWFPRVLTDFRETGDDDPDDNYERSADVLKIDRHNNKRRRPLVMFVIAGTRVKWGDLAEKVELLCELDSCHTTGNEKKK